MSAPSTPSREEKRANPVSRFVTAAVIVASAFLALGCPMNSNLTSRRDARSKRQRRNIRFRIGSAPRACFHPGRHPIRWYFWRWAHGHRRVPPKWICGGACQGQRREALWHRASPRRSVDLLVLRSDVHIYYQAWRSEVCGAPCKHKVILNVRI